MIPFLDVLICFELIILSNGVYQLYELAVFWMSSAFSLLFCLLHRAANLTRTSVKLVTTIQDLSRK